MGQHLDILGRQLFVVDSASRDSAAFAAPNVVVLLHGFPTSSWDWHHQWDELATRYRVISFDMLGFGYSDKPHNHRYSIHEQADLVQALLGRLNVSQYAILAHDYGDTVAQELLARDNASSVRSIRAVCLLNGGLFPETHRARLAQKLLVGPFGGVFVRFFGRSALEKNLISVFGKDTPPTTDIRDSFWALTEHNNGKRNLHRLMWYMKDRLQHRARWVSALKDTRAPLALINGSADPVSGAHMVERYRELIGTGSIIELADIGHYPQLEAPGPVTSHVLSFFQEQL